MKSSSIVMMAAAAALALAGCSTDTTKTDAGTNTDAGTHSNPAAPTLGAQIDRMGRAGVNTALTDPFDVSASVGGKSENDVKDSYNTENTDAAFTANKAKIAFNLAVLDGLDRNCGNQFAAATTLSADRYSGLATVLADDKLYVNSASGTCAVYLGVEANATGIIANADCGGRTPKEDVIDETYSLLAIGAPAGVTDGVADDNSAGVTVDTFPFLSAPN